MMADPNARARHLRPRFGAAPAVLGGGQNREHRRHYVTIGASASPRKYTVAVWVGNLEGDSMRAVSGVSGAAPVWRDIMLALNAEERGAPPPRPAGVEQRHISFASGVEQPRLEYFLAGTGSKPDRRRARGISPPAHRQSGFGQRLRDRPGHPARPPAPVDRRIGLGDGAPAMARQELHRRSRFAAADHRRARRPPPAPDRYRRACGRSGAVHDKMNNTAAPREGDGRSSRRTTLF